MIKKAIILLLLFAVLIYCAFYILKPIQKPQEANTGFEVTNTTKDSVLMYLTINYPKDSSYVQSVNEIFGIKSTELQGSVWIKPKDTLRYTPKLKFSGNISFGSPPINCPSDDWINGVNIVEWSVNVPKGSNECLDISCVSGVNSIIKIDLLSGANWLANGKIIKTTQNNKMWNNTGIYGVFPYGCTNCINTDGKQPCQTPSEATNKQKICTLTRDKDKKGGVNLDDFIALMKELGLIQEIKKEGDEN